MNDTPTIKCDHCSLVQFDNRPNCRRCRKPFPVEIPPEPEPAPAMPGVQPAPSDSRSRTQSRGPRFLRSRQQNIAAPTTVFVACLLRLREYRGMSQRELARAVGLPRTWVSKIENHTSPTLGSIARIAAGLRVPIPALIDADLCTEFVTADLLADPFIAEVAPYVRQLSRTARNGVVAFAFARSGA